MRRSKRLAVFVAVLMLAVSLPAAAGNIRVVINGTEQTFSPPPFIEDGRTLVPMRAFFESLGAKVFWDEANQEVTAIKGNDVVTLKIGSKTATVNGDTVSLAVPAQIIDGHTFVPLRFVGEALGCSVGWDPGTSTITVESLAAKVKKSVEEIARQEQSVVFIKVHDRNGNVYALGSGFIVSPDGLIVTNYHVIDGAYGATVQIQGNTYEVAGVTAYDPDKDLAVLKINQTGLIPVKLGDSSAVKLGEEVVAIGSPGGLENTVSTGIVSGIRTENGRTILQTDAPISPGSSGGALFNMYGEVIGITFAGASDPNMHNIGFAIPINEVKPLLNQTNSPVALNALAPSFKEFAAMLRDGGYLDWLVGGIYSIHFNSVEIGREDGCIRLDLKLDYLSRIQYFFALADGYSDGLASIARQICGFAMSKYPQEKIKGTVRYGDQILQTFDNYTVPGKIHIEFPQN